MARDRMTLDEAIQFTKQALEKVNPDKRVFTEFRFTVWQVKQLLVWLEDYKQLKDDYADLDNRLRTANTENDELKRMLNNSLEALDAMAENVRDECGEAACGLYEYDSPLNEYGEMIYECEGVNGNTDCFKWRYRDEAMKLLGGADNAKNFDSQN